MYPRLTFDLEKLREHLEIVGKAVKGAGCSMMIVTKSFTADPVVTEMIAEYPMVDFLADSRIENIKKYSHLKIDKVLMRLPMACEVDEVVKYAAISFNSEPETIRLLNEAAKRAEKKHGVLLMIDMGDLREGIFFQNEKEIFNTVREILTMEHIELCGIGVNLTCYGAVIPTKENLSQLVALAEKVEKEFNISLHMISGGNSSSYYLIDKGEMPAGVSNLRLGEAFILGNETAYGQRIPGTYDDSVFLEAQIIELKTKPSLPIGEIGVDAFGQRPVYEDRGNIKRAILGLGKQDVDKEDIIPVDSKIDILGASSDHLILDVTKSDTDYKVGDVIRFRLEYGGLLKASTSPYVKKDYLK